MPWAWPTAWHWAGATNGSIPNPRAVCHSNGLPMTVTKYSTETLAAKTQQARRRYHQGPAATELHPGRDRSLEGSESTGYTTAKPYQNACRHGDIINSDGTQAPAGTSLLKGYAAFVWPQSTPRNALRGRQRRYVARLYRQQRRRKTGLCAPRRGSQPFSWPHPRTTQAINTLLMAHPWPAMWIWTAGVRPAGHGKVFPYMYSEMRNRIPGAASRVIMQFWFIYFTRIYFSV